MNIESVIDEKHSGDDEQLSFIKSNSKHIIVTAPAGCGKTTAMVSKIAWELCNGGLDNHKKILAMTFSVNAAMKIKESVKEMLPGLVDNANFVIKKIDIANYHHFAIRLLHKYGFILHSAFTNLSEFIIKDDNSISSLSYLDEEEKALLSKIEKALKCADRDAVECLINEYWDLLLNTLIPHQIITYNGILIAAYMLLCNSEVKTFYQKYYQMVIIDEFQDTNLLGYFLVESLIGNNNSVFLGDDIQKIYGFLGAINGALEIASKQYDAEEFVFKHNYRFHHNDRMKQMDLFIRDYGLKYSPSNATASVLLKILQDDLCESEFICNGIKKIIESTDRKVAVLVRAGWMGQNIVEELEREKIPFFNALYSETDTEYVNFYNIAIEEFHLKVPGKAVRRNLNACLEAVKKRENEVYSNLSKKYVFDSLFNLLKILFAKSIGWEGNSTERYINIEFCLGNNGLKHMMEYIQERTVLTTIHSSKGLEWDYVIIPRLNAHVFPQSKYMCKPCESVNGCTKGSDFCKCNFTPIMKKLFMEEISVFYVALTRAKKDVFLTVNTGNNQWGYPKRINCLLGLPGLSTIQYDWDNVIY